MVAVRRCGFNSAAVYAFVMKLQIRISFIEQSHVFILAARRVARQHHES